MKSREATSKQKEVLDFIISFYRMTGTAPNFNQIKEALNYDSLTPVYTCVRELETKGYLAMRSSEQPDIIPIRKRSGAWLQEPSVRQSNRIPVVGRFQHGLLTASEIVSPRDQQNVLGWLSDQEDGLHVDFAAISEGFAGVGETIDRGSALLCCLQSSPEEGDIIVERIAEDWKLSRYTSGKDVVATIVCIVSAPNIESI